ncbi:acyl-CoA dehydrogenase family protein [Noviherbaspirillum saxi]|uniref:Acyl-CoA dehydrogenase n=1 Tax=Noviherbaspirillum saxi TaxID=2320863 RepID=A0A3A3FK52_9BURK|nr:acyl-CoA dehydrogenase family protein [Noviherbaspirillum saxi]RJF91715.1 acyl-CoA dehydrogenase [Noviherbaspirillum saxi]
MNEQNDDLEMIRHEARRFLGDVALPEHLKALLEVPGSFDRQIWNSAVDLGWPATLHAEENGGLGLGWSGLCVLAEEMGRKTVSLPLMSSAVAAYLVLSAGGAVFAQDLGKQLISGERHACLALVTDGEAGNPQSGVIDMKGGKLHGRTAVVPFGASADYALVTAQSSGVTQLVLVALEQKAVTRDIVPTIDNSRAGAVLRFDGAEAYSLATGTYATQRLRQLSSAAALVTAFEQLGGAQACLDMARDYALERKAFGQPIGRFQSIKAKLADMYTRIEISRGCALDALGALERGEPEWFGLAAAARVGATDAYEIAARENVQTHGAIGVTWEALPHHHYRRSRALAVELGSAAAWRERLMAEIGCDRAAH